jgi:hypothetical protein
MSERKSSPKRRRGSFTTSPSPPSSPQSIFQPPQSIIEGVDLSLQPKQRQGPPPDLPLQLPQSIVQPKRRRGPDISLFIIASCHGELEFNGALPVLINLKTIANGHLKNFEKKSVGSPGQNVNLAFTNPKFAKPAATNILLDKLNLKLAKNIPLTPVEEQEMSDLIKKQQRYEEVLHDSSQIDAYLHSLLKEEQQELYGSIAAKLISEKEFPIDNHDQIIVRIMSEYEQYGNLLRTYPTQELVEQMNNELSVFMKLANELYPDKYEYDIKAETFSCIVQKGPTTGFDSYTSDEIIQSVYSMETDHPIDGLTFGFNISGQVQHYNIFYKAQIEKLIYDIKLGGYDSTIVENVIGERGLNLLDDRKFFTLERSVVLQLVPELEGRSEIPTILCLSEIRTSEILLIAAALQDTFKIKNVKMVDMSCKSFVAERSNERSDKRRIEIAKQYIYGGYHKNKSKSRKYKSRKYKSRKYKSRKYK